MKKIILAASTLAAMAMIAGTTVALADDDGSQYKD